MFFLKLGLTSFGGPGDGRPDNYPAVFTRVYDYIDWIESKTGKSVCKIEIEEVINEIFVDEECISK